MVSIVSRFGDGICKGPNRKTATSSNTPVFACYEQPG